jgi:hypothetical protein
VPSLLCKAGEDDAENSRTVLFSGVASGHMRLFN